MDVREALFKDFDKKRELRNLQVELLGKTFTIYYMPVMSTEQQAAIYKHIDTVTGAIDLEAFVTNLIVRALNEDGARMFQEVERQELRTKVDSEVLAEIAAKMGGLVEKVDPKG